MFFCAKFRCFQSSEFAQFSHLVFNSAIVTNVFGYDTLRKNPQDSFRRSRKIANCNEIPIGISAAMNYSHCSHQFLFSPSSFSHLLTDSNSCLTISLASLTVMRAYFLNCSTVLVFFHPLSTAPCSVFLTT